MLIDDDKYTNQYHQIIIDETEMCNETIVFQYADEALEWLKNLNEQEFPTAIFLDINMPRMNGFEFLEEYENTFPDKNLPIIVMLTTSLNSSDQQISKKYKIHDFMNKPLDENMIHRLDTEFGIHKAVPRTAS